MRLTKLFFFILLFFLQELFTASAQTANWSAYLPPLFPTNASGQINGISRVSQMKFHPSNSSKMYAVSARGGLFISTNGGNNWSLAPGCDAMPFSTFASVCVDFSNDQVIYLGAGDHDYYSSWGGATGVWKSTDGGATFTQTSLNNKIIIDMVMDPLDHNTIVAVTNSGVYKTTGAGSTWTLKSTSRSFDDLKQKASASRVLYACTTDSAFFRSNDFGDTWTQINSGIVLPAGVTNGNGCRIAVTPADTNIVYLGMTANSGIIYKSTNGGTSFTAIKTSVPPYLTYYDNSAGSSGQGDYNFGIGVDAVNANILYLVAHNVWKSTDGGVSWTQLTNWYAKCHTDMHQVNTSPYNNGQLWNMNDGGVWLSTDGGANWTPKSDGIYGYEIYHGSCSPTRRDVISIGTQDNGELYATSAGWFTNRGGDWQSHCVFDYRASSTMVYYFYPDWGGVPGPRRRLVNGGDATYGLPANVTDISDICFYRGNSNVAYVADTSIYRTTNLTVTTPAWTSIVNLNKKIMTLHCSFADANRLYVITNDGFIYVSTNALGASPTFTSYALPSATSVTASITSIKTSPNTIYIVCNSKVYRSTDNGATWTNITYNLPSVNQVSILADEFYSGNELVFVASNNAVYYKTAGATSWTIYNLNLPIRTSIVNMSIYNDSTTNTLLRVATYGRGIWETPINNLRTLTANFTADNTDFCANGTVQFTDLTTGNATSRTWSFPGGTPSTSTAVNPTIVYNSTGSFNVSLTVSDGTTNNTKTNLGYITVNSVPSAAGAISGSLNACQGQNGVSYTVAPIANATGYVWTLPTGVSIASGANTNMIIVNFSSVASSGTISVYGTHGGCSGTSSSATLTVNTLPSKISSRTFTNSSLITINDNDVSSPYPSTIFVSGFLGFTQDINVILSGFNHTYPDDLDLMLESPTGQRILLMSDCGGGNDLVNTTITLNDSAIDYLPDANVIVTGSYKPANYESPDNFPAPGPLSFTAPLGTSSSLLNTFNGFNPNGTWYLYVVDDAGVDIGTIASWSLIITGPLPNDTPVVSGIASVCQGQNNVAYSTPVVAGITGYTWTLPSGCTIASGLNTNSITVNYSGGAVSGNIQVTPVNNCGNSTASSSFPVSVNASGAANVSISVSPTGSICSGTQVIFTATPFNSGASPGYQWRINNINVSTGSTYTVNSLANNDTVKCVMTSNSTCVTGNPATSNSIIMTVNPAVNASVSIAYNPPGAICSGTSVTFTATPSNGGTSPTYQWKKNSANVATGSTFTTSVLTTNDTIKCIMTSNASCVSGNPATSNSMIITVNPNVAASLSITANPAGAICSGTSVTFTPAPANGGSSPSYQWKKNSVVVGIGSSYTTTSLSNNDTIKCVMTSNATCATGNPATSNAIIMVVNPSVNASVSIASNPAGPICAGTSVTFTATGLNGGTSPSYLWKKNGVSVRIGQTYTYASFNNNDTVKCILTSNASCVNGNPATSNAIVMNVNPNLFVSISIAAVPSGPICPNTAVTFTASPTNGGTTPSYQWKKNSMDVATGNSYSSSTLVNNDTVKCILTSGATCSTGNPATSNSIIMTLTNCSGAITLNLKAMIEGLYSGAGKMRPMLYENGMSSDSTACDSITVELRSSIQLNSPVYSVKTILHRDGHASVPFPSGAFGNSYYIVIRHRNSIETWSKNILTFDSSVMNIDFTSP